MSRPRASLILGVLLCASAPANAEAPGQVQPMNFLPAIAGDYFPLASKATGTLYHIYIRYPQGYAEAPDQRYPVVYLLDGDSVFPLVAAQHLFLTIDDKLPEAIVVGVAYGAFDPKVNRRDVDFGPRAADFNRFLSSELIPAVESRSRADPDRRILVGQSYGGGYVLYSALTQPDLFWARIASNPSFRLREDLWGEAASATRSDLRLFVVDGTANHAQPRETTARWVESWNARRKPWALERLEIEGGTHAADIGNAYRVSLRKLFDWSPPPASVGH